MPIIVGGSSFGGAAGVSTLPSGALSVAPVAYYNWTRSNTLRLRGGIAKARQGDAPCVIACNGDSNTTGHGAGTDGATGYISAALRNLPFVLGKLFGTNGIPAAESNWGTQNLPLSTWAAGFDPRASIGSSWGIGSAVAPCLGGYMWLNSGVGTPWSFTPQNAYDTVDVYFIQGPSFATSVAVTINGAAKTPINPIGAQAFQKVTYTQTLGTGTITLTPNTGTFYLVGVETYNSAKPGIVVRNWAYDGGRAVNFINNTNPWDHLVAFNKMAPAAVVLNLMINDCNTNTSFATWMSQMQTIIAAYQRTSDVILHTCFPVQYDTNYLTQAHVDQFRQGKYALADQFNIPLMDSFTRLGGADPSRFAALTALGYTYNAFHMSALGYADTAAGLANGINALD